MRARRVGDVEIGGLRVEGEGEKSGARVRAIGFLVNKR